MGVKLDVLGVCLDILGVFFFIGFDKRSVEWGRVFELRMDMGGEEGGNWEKLNFEGEEFGFVMEEVWLNNCESMVFFLRVEFVLICLFFIIDDEVMWIGFEWWVLSFVF